MGDTGCISSHECTRIDKSITMWTQLVISSMPLEFMNCARCGE